MIPYEIYFWIVTACALVYTSISQVVRGKFVNMERMKTIQKDLNEYNKQYFDAMKKNNSKKMEEVKARQDALMPEFNGMMMGQFKVMGVIIVVFMSFMWVLGAIDPHIEDDLSFELSLAGDGEWCGEIPLGPNEGPWEIDVTAFEGDALKSERGVTIFYIEASEFLPSGKVTGEEMNVFADKDLYLQDESAVVCAVPPANADRVVATANSGTWFHVGLPFEIPVLETRTLNGVNIWFILVAIVGGLGIARVKKAIEEKG
ncbi:DUF106 domain-containing protein [Candidatus Micrarchaeota archaeon]|nr:DUF106 domain-containing protein [Candidatus Micrarchaeota archaeon]